MAYLSDKEFELVSRCVPIVALDLIVSNSRGEVLLGLRNNSPARGFWFTPGGRVRKGEQLSEAFNRIASEELNIEADLADATFQGVHEHFYDDNFQNDAFGTHYIDLVYLLRRPDLDLAALPLNQHRHHRWYPVEQLLSSQAVHDHIKRFFGAQHRTPVLSALID
jgi:colanic acid biosynthesis protein WcaH